MGKAVGPVNLQEQGCHNSPGPMFQLSTIQNSEKVVTSIYEHLG